MPHSPRERDAAIAALDPRGQAAMRQFAQHGFLYADALASKLGADVETLKPVLARLRALGLVEEIAPSPMRPFAPIWRMTPVRFFVVRDLLEGGEADAGRGWRTLSDVQRDWPWVSRLDDPADGAEAEALRRRREAEAESRREVDAARHAAEAVDADLRRRRKSAALDFVRALDTDLGACSGIAADAGLLAEALYRLLAMEGVAPSLIERTRLRLDELGTAA